MFARLYILDGLPDQEFFILCIEMGGGPTDRLFFRYSCLKTVLRYLNKQMLQVFIGMNMYSWL